MPVWRPREPDGAGAWGTGELLDITAAPWYHAAFVARAGRRPVWPIPPAVAVRP